MIEKERFEAWLGIQPDDRKWNFMDLQGCAGACFIRETTSYSQANLGGTYWRENWAGGEIPLPEWLHKTLVGAASKSLVFTAYELKAAYRKIVPEPQPTHEQKQQTPCGATPEGMQEERSLAHAGV